MQTSEEQRALRPVTVFVMRVRFVSALSVFMCLKRWLDAFVTALAEETAQMHMGSGLEKRTEVGPMINQRQRAHVLSQWKMRSARAQLWSRAE